MYCGACCPLPPTRLKDPSDENPTARGAPRTVAAAELRPAPAWGADAPAVPHYVLDPSKSTLEFNFSQAGAQNKGKFKRFPAIFDFAPDNLAASRLDVTIEVGSLDTGDQERDDTLRSADLFAVSKFPQAHFSATQIAKTASRLRGDRQAHHPRHDPRARVPFTFRTATEAGASVVYMSRQDHAQAPRLRGRPGRLEGHRSGGQRGRRLLRAAAHGARH